MKSKLEKKDSDEDDLHEGVRNKPMIQGEERHRWAQIVHQSSEGIVGSAKDISANYFYS